MTRSRQQAWILAICLLIPGVVAEDLQTKLHDLSWADLSCLRQEPKGCAVLKDQFSCLSSKSDAEAPCLWCGGGPCLAGSLNLCESLPAFKGADKATISGTVALPSCVDGSAAVFKKKKLEIPVPTQEQLSKLSPVKEGCISVKDMSTCVSSKDGSGNATWGYTPYKVSGEACVWCGGVACTDATSALCMPFDLLMNGQGPHHNVFYAQHTFKVAEVKEAKFVFPPSDLSCLSKENKGCPSLLDAYDCLASADGRPDETIFGRKVKGQPCVWCHGKFCNERGAKCEPYDLQMNGEGYAFTTSYSKDPQVAQCKDGRVKPHVNVTKPVLNLPKPDMEKLHCLVMKDGGCKMATDKLSCLSSRDGSDTDAEGGLAIRGQPCVWCGGGACTDESEAKCAPYEYFAHGAGKVFANIMTVSTTVAECHEQEMTFNEADVGCLRPANQGCNLIRDAVNCTNSREERPYEYIAGFKVKGQPCVWCGGGQCHDGADTLCEPYDYALYGAGHAFHTKYSNGPFYKAFCDKENQPGAVALPADWQIHGMRMHVDCGKPFPVWAKVGERCGFCKVLVPSIKEYYNTCKDYCAAQGNLKCTSAAMGSLNSCGVKEEKSCDYAFQVYDHAICECSINAPLEDLNAEFDKALASPSQADLNCLKKADNGCRAVTDRLSCLSSVDNGLQESFHGLRVKGEPCVWCGGVACTSKDPTVLCEARDYLVNGKGLAFVHRHVAVENADVAKCQAPQRSFGNVACLKRQESGCNTIKDIDTCLSSLDGRPFDQVAGLKVEGQPCVWCGGVPCNSNNGNLCEPYDFALHGEGHAYDVNHAEDTYYTAACEAGHPVKHSISTAMARVGISTLVDCGTPQPIWQGVGKRCGSCKVQVAVEAAKSYGNCDGYCQHQGLSCEKAYSSHLHSCDLKSEETMSCQTSFSDELTGYLCQCQAPHQAQAMYGQCGGRDWKGYTQCEVGAVCNVVDQDFSQCVPATAAKPGVRVHALQTPVQSTLAAAAPSLKDDLGSAPPEAVKGSSSCSSHPKCASLKLSGDCCPNAEGVLLDCCTKYDDTKSVVLNPAVSAETPEAVPLEAGPATGATAESSEWWKIPKPSEEHLKCMPAEPKGCGSIKHKLMCLSRVDGRIGYAPHGLNVGGEPCVWCGGQPCTSYSDALCEPYNWLVNGQGKAFASQNTAPSSWLVAKCQDDKNAVFNNLGCLQRSEIGCNHITEKHQCLASTDARPFVEVAGFKARSQPCVWCGGGTCHSNNGNLCEPYDFVMNGQGQAFESNYGFNTYMVAECTQDGRVLPMSYPHANVERGLPTQVKCGEAHIWNGVGKICGDCDVTVPNIYAFFGSCNSYCAAQGGLKCLSAKKSFTHSCSEQPPGKYDLNCESVFAAGEFARCQCSASEKASEALVTENANFPGLPYSQCGGKEWTGVTNCQAGSTCFIINRWYSQCLPGANSNPDQAAQAAKNAAEAIGKPVEDQAVAAGEAATKAASAAGQNSVSQATRAYVAAAGTAAISGLARPQASGIGEAAAHAASNSDPTLSDKEAKHVAENAIKAGEAIVFGDDQSSDAAEIAGAAAANSAKDTGMSGHEQCHKAYHAALALAKGSGKTVKQQAELAAHVAQRAAFRAELTPLQQVQCVVDAAQASAISSGEFSDGVATAMTTAGATAAEGAGIADDQVEGVVATSIKAAEEATAATIPPEVIEKCMATAEDTNLGAAAEEVALSGLSAEDASKVARKCIYDAAIKSGSSPPQAAAASEAAAQSVAQAINQPSAETLKPAPVQRIGEDCWMACGQQSGLCAFCGIGNACCRKDEETPVKACQNIKTFSTWHHECVQPVHLPQDVSAVAQAVTEAEGYEKANEAGAIAAVAAKATGSDVHDQAIQAGAIAAEEANNNGLNTVNQVTAAYKVTEATGKEGGMTQYDADKAAQSVAQVVAESNGMSTAEAATAAAAAAAVVHGMPLPATGTVPPLTPPVLEPGPVILNTPAPKVPPHVAVEPPVTPPLVKPPVVPEKVEGPILPQPIPAAAQAGIDQADTAKQQGADVHGQAVAGASATGSYEVGDHQTQEEAKEMATKVAKYVSHEEGLPINEAKTEAEKAVADAIKSQGGEFVAPTILPSPVPPSIQAGIAAAEATPTVSVHDKAVAAAATTGSQEVNRSNESTAQHMATQAAEYVAHKNGMTISEAKAEGTRAAEQAVAAQGGHFVHQRQMKNGGKECWAACGSKAGYCPTFCGLGACCTKMDHPANPECQNATQADHYECVLPAAIFPTGSIKHREADSNSTVFVMKTPQEKIEEEGFGIGLWLVVLAAVISCLVCCIGWFCCVPPRHKKSSKGQTRTAGVSISKSDGEDLELQEPLQTAVPAGMRTIGEAPPVLVAPAPTSYRYVAGSSQGYFAAPTQEQAASIATRAMMAPPVMAPARSLATAPVAGSCAPCPAATPWDQFDRIDTNHDGVIQRSEWDEAMQVWPQGRVVETHPSAAQDLLIPRQAIPARPVVLRMEPTTQGPQ